VVGTALLISEDNICVSRLAVPLSLKNICGPVSFHLVMLYVGGKLFSKVEHIEFQSCVCFKGFIASKTTLQLKINS